MVHFPLKGESVWNHTAELTQYAPLRHDMQIDVAIIGAGITGLTTAYLLKQAGVKVAVIEKYKIGDSISGHTTAKVTSQHGMIYAALAKNFDRETARIYGEANQAAIGLIEDIIRTEKIDCDWRREDNYVFGTEQSETSDLIKEAKTAVDLGLPAEYVTSMPLDIKIAGAVKFRDQATFHIVKYLHGLARAVHGNGSYVFEDTKAVNISDDEPCRFHVPGGKVVANHVILATNVPAPLKDHTAYSLYVHPVRSYLVSGHIQRRIPGMYISASNPTRSILPAVIDGKNWLLVGGEGHLVGMGGFTDKRYDALQTYGRNRGMEKAAYKWSAWDYVAYDQLPIIGKLYPNSKNVYTATGFQKWGMTNGTVAAMILTDLLTKTPNPWADTFGDHFASAAKSLPKGLLKSAGFRK